MTTCLYKGLIIVEYAQCSVIYSCRKAASTKSIPFAVLQGSETSAVTSQNNVNNGKGSKVYSEQMVIDKCILHLAPFIAIILTKFHCCI